MSGYPIKVENITKEFRIRLGKEPTLKGALMDRVHRRKSHLCFPALKDISFAVEKGETLGIIGENGSGKSTMLCLLGGITKPTSGRITVDGSISTLIELGAGFHGDLTGRENVYLNGSILGLSHGEMDEKMEQIISFAELEDFIEQPVKYYSSGMYVRLGFAVAVEVDPDILLVDEVLAVGDQYFQKKCFRRIDDFQKRGKTIVFVSHALGIVEELCDRVILLQKGEILCQGEPGEVLRDYQKRVLVKDNAIEVREWGTREAVITGVRFFDAGGKETRKFVSWEPMEVEISYRASSWIDKPIFGFSIHDGEGISCFGSNTQLAGCEVPGIEGEGSVRLRIERLTLGQGNFFFNFSLHSSDHTVQYHRLDFMHEVQVENAREARGYLELDTKWDIDGRRE